MPVDAELVKWPTKAEDMTVDLMLRLIGNDTQLAHLRKWKDIDTSSAEDRFKSETYHLQTQLVIGNVGLMMAICALRNIDPVKAEAFVRDYWTLCDAGDEFGPLLWEITEAAGLDPSTITLPETSPA